MKAIPPESRTQNVSARDFCRWCADDGLIVATVRPVKQNAFQLRRGIVQPEGQVYEEMGPCPFCERGHQIEFQKGGAWFPLGYWQGRDVVDLEPLYAVGSAPLPQSEQRKLALQFAAIGKQVPE